MKQTTKKYMTEDNFNRVLANIKGTMAMEGLEISSETEELLRRVCVDGEDYKKVINEIIAKYWKETE